MEEHDRGTTESQNPAKITQSGRTQIAGQSENWDGSGWWTGDCCAHAWEDTTWDPPAPHPMPSPSVQSQATSTQRGSIQMLGGLMCELSGCNERRQGAQNEMMSRDDNQVQNELTNCQKHWYKNWVQCRLTGCCNHWQENWNRLLGAWQADGSQHRVFWTSHGS